MRWFRHAGIDTVPTTDFDLQAKIALAVAHSRHPVFVKNGQVLKCIGHSEQALNHHRGFANRLDAFRSHCADHPRSKSRSGKGDASEQFRGKTQGLTHCANAVLAQLNERLDNPITESFLGIDPELLEDIVLPLDPGDGFVDIG